MSAHPLLTEAHRLVPVDDSDVRRGWSGAVGGWHWEVLADIDATGSPRGTWLATAILVGSLADAPCVVDIDGAPSAEQAAAALVVLVPELVPAPDITRDPTAVLDHWLLEGATRSPDGDEWSGLHGREMWVAKSCNGRWAARIVTGAVLNRASGATL